MNAQGDKTDDNSNKKDNEDADVETDTENSKNGPKRRILTAKREKKSSQRAEANTSGTEAVLKAVKELQLSIDKKFDEMKQENQSVVKQLQEQIGQVRVEFNNRMDGLSKKVESKVTQNVKKNIDDNFKSVKKDMESEMSRVKNFLFLNVCLSLSNSFSCARTPEYTVICTGCIFLSWRNLVCR